MYQRFVHRVGDQCLVHVNESALWGILVGSTDRADLMKTQVVS